MPPSEEWRTAPGLEGRYEISNFGRARHMSGRVRKLKSCKRGYLWLSVSVSGGRCVANKSMARLVCGAFNGPPPHAAMDCDHINRIRNDNRPENLRWVTREENLANRQVCFGSGHPLAKLTPEQVLGIRAMPFRRGQDRVIADRIGVSRETVRDVRLGKAWRPANVS